MSDNVSQTSQRNSLIEAPCIFRVNGRDISCVTLSTSKLTHRPAGECPCCGESLYRCVVCSADYCPVCAEVDCAACDGVKHLCNCHDEEEE